MEGITYRRSSLSSQTNRGESPPCFDSISYAFDDLQGMTMTRAEGDLFVPIILRSILIIIFKEESFEFTTKTDCRG